MLWGRKAKVQSQAPSAIADSGTVDVATRLGAVSPAARPVEKLVPAPRHEVPVSLSTLRELPAATGGHDGLRGRDAVSRQISAAIGDCIRVLGRSASHQQTTLAELEWSVLPAVRARQFAIAEAVDETTQIPTPVGLVLWAMVSSDVDSRISQALQGPIRLAPSEWQSGQVAWLIEATGDTKMVGDLLRRIAETKLAGKFIKMRTIGPDGQPAVGILQTPAS